MKPLRTFEMCSPVTGPLEGGLRDWPSHIQDQIFAAWAHYELEHGVKLELHHSMCEHDPDGYYLRVGLIQAPILLAF